MSYTQEAIHKTYGELEYVLIPYARKCLSENITDNKKCLDRFFPDMEPENYIRTAVFPMTFESTKTLWEKEINLPKPTPQAQKMMLDYKENKLEDLVLTKSPFSLKKESSKFLSIFSGSEKKA